MTAPTFRPGIIDDVQVRTLPAHADERGWLCELFRRDELAEVLQPAMGYLSLTRPGVQRGPHEHRRQTDYFCFLGPARFHLYLWDNRPSSPTYGVFQEEATDPDRVVCVIVPPSAIGPSVEEPVSSRSAAGSRHVLSRSDSDCPLATRMSGAPSCLKSPSVRALINGAPNASAGRVSHPGRRVEEQGHRGRSKRAVARGSR